MTNEPCEETPTNLESGLTTFYAEMDARMKDLSPQEQQQYLEGLVHALDAVTRYAHPGLLLPFDRENFIGAAKSWAYSSAHHRGLDPETRMRALVETDTEGVARCYRAAATAQVVLYEKPLDFEQSMRLQMHMTMLDMDRADARRRNGG